jgi:hypothetical protein
VLSRATDRKLALVSAGWTDLEAHQISAGIVFNAFNKEIR